ncbi:MAG TPA: biotin synthase BioB [Desulfitobacteriaceae bacterium]|jgi:biotin synthase|nr:biotin synthase BioB [Desulfitobacteriaceae bacterium]
MLEKSKRDLIDHLEKKVLDSQDISREEARELGELTGPDLYYLFAAAGRIRDLRAGKKVDLCSIINAKSGKCPENCKYCAQSAHHQTGAEVYDLLDEETILERARKMEVEGAHRFSLITSGRGISEQELVNVLAIYKRLARETKLKLCASLGIITEDTARRLKEVGVSHYHHNLETSESYFPQICTTHSYQDRINTIKACQAADLDVCSGGIISMGETMNQRLEMAFTLRDLNIRSVPINILNPIAGTALEKETVLPPMEILQTLAIFRFILPEASLRFAGGRENALGDLQSLGYLAGMNAALVGSYLTTPGRNVAEDIKMIRDMGLEVTGQ